MTSSPSDGSYEIDCHAVASELREAMTNSEHIPNGQVSDAVIREMLAGLDGVTPGPWYVPEHKPYTPHGGDHWPLLTDSDNADLVAAHIARCDPDTMRQVLTLALDALTRRSSAGVKGETSERPTYAQISDMVHACRERQKAAGEGDQMLSRWISEGLDALALTPPPTLEPTDAEVERLARHITEEIFGCAWDGLSKQEGRVTEKGYKAIAYSTRGGMNINGTQLDMLDVARAALIASRQSTSGEGV